MNYGRSHEVDLFRPEDAKGVSPLFWEVYGDGYPEQAQCINMFEMNFFDEIRQLNYNDLII